MVSKLVMNILFFMQVLLSAAILGGIVAVCTGLISVILPNSDFILLFIFYSTFALSLLSFCYMVSNIFQTNATLAALSGKWKIQRIDDSTRRTDIHAPGITLRGSSFCRDSSLHHLVHTFRCCLDIRGIALIDEQAPPLYVDELCLLLRLTLHNKVRPDEVKQTRVLLDSVRRQDHRRFLGSI